MDQRKNEQALQRVEVRHQIDAPIEKVWARYTDYVSWTRWSGLGRVELERKGHPDPNGPDCVRVISNSGIKVYEEILTSDPLQRVTYTVVRGGLPIKDHLGEVLFASQGTARAGGAGTQVTWRCQFRARTACLGPLYRVLITFLFHRALRGLARDLLRTG